MNKFFVHVKVALVGIHVGVVVAWDSKQWLQSKGNRMARDHLQGSGEKSDTPLPTTLPDWLLTDFLTVYDSAWQCLYVYSVYVCVCMCT